MFSKLTKRLSGMQLIAVGFFIIILIGALLLMLPVSSRSGEYTPFMTALFTATSASCVTGLVVVDTFSHWSLFGQLVILTMIQIGGLGFITIGVTVSMILRKKIGLAQRGLIRESLNIIELSGMVRLTKRIVIGTLFFELTGALILALCFIPKMGLLQGIYYGIFHSISAFCNAGFDLMGRYEAFSSLTGWYDHPIVLITIMLLIIIGGIGFVVWNDLYEHRLHFRKYSLHTKIVLTADLFLLFAGALLFYLIEHDDLFAGMTMTGKILSSFFCAVTPRTAGFNTVNVSGLTDASKLLTVILMFIGGAPGSTAGGIKVTTIVVLLVYLKANLTRTVGYNIFGRRLEDDALRKSAAVFCTNLFLATTAALILCALQNFNGLDTLLEVISAISTVGMTAGLTTQLNMISRMVVILLMYLGRVGSLSFAMSFTDKKKIAHVMQPAEKINIG
ncbi:Trk family potassium uptake protein [Roseburia sp. BX1005]|uniref:Trk family potassium uptake protein n=1 Tax=Roseburia zhanii TaxID=2763064 RepID=A0A923LRP5_9FIRM|nr:TrkH family potassium uptake protein [Roseburia zhanii]MBC5714673.1 Trk family potassium uptake protein [Roseburia zhanii]